jgi:cytochrome b561
MKVTGDVAEANFRYDRTSIVLHWATVVLVAALWLSAQAIDGLFPRGEARVPMRSVHMLMGVILGGIVLARLYWRTTRGARRPRPTDLLDKGAVGVHHLLLTALVAVVLLGLANVWMRGDTFFFLFTVPAFDPANTGLRHLVAGAHEWVANAILILAGVHGAAALFHHYVLRDSILRRMLPR